MNIVGHCLVSLLLSSAVTAYTQGKQPPPPAQPRFKVDPVAPKNEVIFASIKASSTRFSDEVPPETAMTEDEVFRTHGCTIFIPDVRTQENAWSSIVQSATKSLERIGLVPASKKAITQFPGSIALELKSLQLSKRFTIIFHPKDQDDFAATMKGIELLGDRELGPVSYYLRGFALVLEGQFHFTEKGCHVSLSITNRVCGQLLSEDQSKPGAVDAIPDEWMNNRKVTSSIKDALLH